jgi:hypothetical protein
MSHSRILTCLIALAANPFAHAAAPSEADWARCADIDAADARLICYDALFHRAPRPVGAAGAANLVPASAVKPPPASAPAPVPFDPKSFGFTPEQTHAFDTGPASITVHITRIEDNQTGRAVIALDNDQTWSVADSDGRLSAGDTVRIKHASLGAFILLTSSNHTYHVKRLR